MIQGDVNVNVYSYKETIVPGDGYYIRLTQTTCTRWH